MATLYFPTKESPTTTLPIPGLESFPSNRQTRQFQSRRLTGGGNPLVYNYGLTKRFVDLNIQLLSDSDRNSLLDFIEFRTEWASNSFEFVDAQGNFWRNCFFWFDSSNFSQTSLLRYSNTIRIIADSRLIGDETLSFTIAATVSLIETFFDNNTPWCGNEANKLYLQSGQFTSTLKTSEDISGIDITPSGISYNGTNTPWCGDEANKLYLQSGQFTSTLKTSEDISGIDPILKGISYNGTNTPWIGAAFDKLYLQSGQFTSTLKTSEDISGVDNLPSGISTNGTNTPWCGSEADKLYLQSGQFTSTLKTSEDISGIDITPSGISYNGTNTPWCGDEASKLYLQSGQFTSTLKTSEDISGIDTIPTGISTNRYDLRLGI